ncbi:hypothetical protein TSUD_270440 [Trifolium subterraneum]|uniref:Zinc knuckle CX2CX4HX4C domain-containing protein n=1 Tax=Trifolium subterraneum TaxID=3900 RepID=A0A2Z6N629_TRISU|nr:hypothetical protein TSUD_270440 [Trifolium subterraneum]
MENQTNQTITRPRIVIPEAPRMAILEAPAMEQQNQPQSTNPPATPYASRTRFFVYPETDINEGINACKRSILGLGQKHRPKIYGFHSCTYMDPTLGLPPHCKTKKMGASIGKLIGPVEATEFYEFPGKKMIIKIKVAMNVQQPIQTGILIGNHKDGTTWVDFRYEKLPQVCFKCGILGHSDKLCQNEALNMEESTPLGPWIRSNQYGRRVMEEKDRKYHSNPSQSKNFGLYSPTIPASMIAQMEAMKLQEEANKEGLNSSNRQKTSSNGDGRGVWHRTIRHTAQIQDNTDANNNTTPTSIVKRLRMDDSWIQSSNNNMAGPAGQASQSA